jgi:hypothetical protein
MAETECQFGRSCRVGKELWQHILQCNETNCQFPRCHSSKDLLKHHQKCQVRSGARACAGAAIGSGPRAPGASRCPGACSEASAGHACTSSCSRACPVLEPPGARPTCRPTAATCRTLPAPSARPSRSTSSASAARAAAPALQQQPCRTSRWALLQRLCCWRAGAAWACCLLRG